MRPVNEPPRATHDPAPSRWSYRMHRMWLTPVYRRLLRLGTPALLLGAAGLWYLSDTSRIEAINERAAEFYQSVQDRPEFTLNMMSIETSAPELAEAVRAEFPIRFPISSFDLDLDAMRLKVEEFSAVADARVRVRPGGVLAIEIDERVPAVLWRHGAGLTLLDEAGHVVAGTEDRGAWPNLPLVAGEGAREVIPEALELIAAVKPLEERLRGIVRVGERRWDLILDRNQKVLLPEENPVAAVERMIALDKGRDMLERDVSVIDFRNPRRPTVRLNNNAVHELQRIRDERTVGVNQ